MNRQVATCLTWACLGMAAGLGMACVGTQRAVAQTASNPDAALVEEFQNHVAEYMKLRKSAEAAVNQKPLKPTRSSEVIRHHQHKLREAIVAQRAGAVPGDVFTSEIAAEFRRLIGIAYQADAQHIRESLKRAEPLKFHVHVNKEYPDDKPLQSMPPSLLANLPPLPPELEYRIVGRDLILRDVGANLIVDIIRRAIPR
jgi:hypothetical protein